MFGLLTIAQQCHSLEDLIAETGLPPSSSRFQALDQRWHFIVTEVNKLLALRGDIVELDRAQLTALEAAAHAKDTMLMVREIERLCLEPTATRLHHMAEQAQLLAARLGKEGLLVRVESNNVRLEPRRWSAFWQTFVHGVRNAVDHGIEMPGERGGKSGAGKLTLRSYIDDRHIVIEIEDDGRGVNWAKVAERARAHGLPYTTHEELNAALFVGGFTTSNNVTDISGRGIGMGALLAGTRVLGGELDVSSKTGAGTTIRMKFPLEAALDDKRFAIAS